MPSMDYISSEEYDYMSEDDYLQEQALIHWERELREKEEMHQIFKEEILENRLKKPKFVTYEHRKVPRFIRPHNPTVRPNIGVGNTFRRYLRTRGSLGGNMPQLPHSISQIRRSIYSAKKKVLSYRR